MSAASTERYHRLKAEGFCVQCGMREPLGVRCSTCLERQRESAERFRTLRRAQGRCVQCSRALEGPGWCKQCRYKRVRPPKKHASGTL